MIVSHKYTSRRAEETENLQGDSVSIRELNLHSGLLGLSHWTWTLNMCRNSFNAGYGGGLEPILS